MKIFITGGSGLIGAALTDALLRRGDQPLVLSRDARRATERLGPDVLVVEGDPTEYGDWAARVDSCDAVVNLAGEPVFGKRWNERQKERLRASRVQATTNVVRAIGEAPQRPSVLVSASAVGYYGDVPEGELTEDARAGDDFLARTCEEWENAARQVLHHGTRLSIIRIGVVLARDGGALKQMIVPFKLGLGGPVGRGRQWVSWIHLDDMVRLLVHAVETPGLNGALNAAAPNAVTNAEFTQVLGRTLRRPAIFPVPEFAVRTLFGEMASIVIGGQKVIPEATLKSGFRFEHEQLAAALAHLLTEKRAE